MVYHVKNCLTQEELSRTRGNGFIYKLKGNAIVSLFTCFLVAASNIKLYSILYIRVVYMARLCVVIRGNIFVLYMMARLCGNTR